MQKEELKSNESATVPSSNDQIENVSPTDGPSKTPTAADLERNLVLVQQDLSEVKVGPNFTEDLPEKKDFPEKDDSTVKDAAELLVSDVREDGSVENPEESSEVDLKENIHVDNEEKENECASGITDTESHFSTSSLPSETEGTILSMIPDDISETVEDQPENKRAKLDKKIKQMKRFLSGTLKKRKEIAIRVRDSIDNPNQTEVKSSLRKKKGNKRKRGLGKLLLR